MDLLEWVLRRAAKIIREWSTSSTKRLRELGLVSLEKRAPAELYNDLIAVCRH